VRRVRGNVRRSTRDRATPNDLPHCRVCFAKDRWWITLVEGQCPRCGYEAELEDIKRKRR